MRFEYLICEMLDGNTNIIIKDDNGVLLASKLGSLTYRWFIIFRDMWVKKLKGVVYQGEVYLEISVKGCVENAKTK